MDKEQTEIYSEHEQAIEADNKFPQLALHNQMSRTQQKDEFYMAKKDHFEGIKLDRAQKGNQDDDVVSVPNQNARNNQSQINKLISPYDYADKKQYEKETMRAHQLSSKVIDLTHDTLPENEWRPIQKTFNRVPPQGIIDDRILLREWEQEHLIEYYKKIFDRKDYDIDVFKKLQANGDIIKMAADARELTKDKVFWRTEEEIHDKARIYINKLKGQQPFDVHKLHPQTYDLKMLGDPARGGSKKKSTKELDKKKADAAKKQKKKTAAKIGGEEGKGLLDEIEEDVKQEDKASDSGESATDDNPDDKYDPLARNKEGVPRLKKQSMLQSAVE